MIESIVPVPATSVAESEPVTIYSATYSGVPVYEMLVNTVPVMKRRVDGYINATQVLKVAGVPKPRRNAIMQREVLDGCHEKIQGGYGKFQGTWVPLSAGRALSRSYGVESDLTPLFDFDPDHLHTQRGGPPSTVKFVEPSSQPSSGLASPNVSGKPTLSSSSAPSPLISVVKHVVTSPRQGPPPPSQRVPPLTFFTQAISTLADEASLAVPLAPPPPPPPQGHRGLKPISWGRKVSVPDVFTPISEGGTVYVRPPVGRGRGGRGVGKGRGRGRGGCGTAARSGGAGGSLTGNVGVASSGGGEGGRASEGGLEEKGRAEEEVEEVAMVLAGFLGELGGVLEEMVVGEVVGEEIEVDEEADDDEATPPPNVQTLQTLPLTSRTHLLSLYLSDTPTHHPNDNSQMHTPLPLDPIYHDPPMHWAARLGRLHTLLGLLDVFPASLRNQRDGTTPLMRAVSGVGCVEKDKGQTVVRWLGETILERDLRGRTALHWAVVGGWWGGLVEGEDEAGTLGKGFVRFPSREEARGGEGVVSGERILRAGRRVSRCDSLDDELGGVMKMGGRRLSRIDDDTTEIPKSGRRISIHRDAAPSPVIPKLGRRVSIHRDNDEATSDVSTVTKLFRSSPTTPSKRFIDIVMEAVDDCGETALDIALRGFGEDDPVVEEIVRRGLGGGVLAKRKRMRSDDDGVEERRTEDHYDDTTLEVAIRACEEDDPVVEEIGGRGLGSDGSFANKRRRTRDEGGEGRRRREEWMEEEEGTGVLGRVRRKVEEVRGHCPLPEVLADVLRLELRKVELGG
ncbi:hypothetical protein HDU67_002235 [Dinochytrium kinnereticum]|nr:hypothetical protein HDU67_002235 [Dinochytrium kinnereticum]